ncbi:MAG: transcription-repair coupling factor [Holosporaceae bacterium]
MKPAAKAMPITTDAAIAPIALPPLTTGQAVTLYAAPQGYRALQLAGWQRAAPGRWLVVTADERSAASWAADLAVVAPELTVLPLPAWDCLPYDRSPPHAAVMGQRLATLYRLHAESDAPVIVIAPVAALLQRVLPAPELEKLAFPLKAGALLNRDNLLRWMNDQGYERMETVREPGQYAVRGGLLDLFAPAGDQALRLDFFGAELERLRRFDPLSQRSLAEVEEALLLPASEISLNEATIRRFRDNYRATFGAAALHDPLYLAIAEGRRFSGAEHWLPLFYDQLASPLSYFGANTRVVMEEEEEVAPRSQAILQSVQEYAAARRQHARTGDTPYRPLAEGLLYLKAAEWQQALAAYPVGQWLARERLPTHLPGLAEQPHWSAGGEQGFNFVTIRQDASQNLLAKVVDYIQAEWAAGQAVILTCYSEGSSQRLGQLLREAGLTNLRPAPTWPNQPQPQLLEVVQWPLAAGFRSEGLTVISEADIFGERLGASPSRSQSRGRRAENFIRDLTALLPGDLVVHADHGIGKFEGLTMISAGGVRHDCLCLIYADNAKLYLPVENLELLSRFGGEEAAAGVALDRLGGAAWQARKARVKKRLLEMAEQLIHTAASRAMAQAPEIAPDQAAYQAFCARFPYAETEDQEQAIADVLADLAAGKAMDRLVCGDVGFGKTEVALRAACAVALSGWQVAVVAPTTLLVRQHAANFTNRFGGLPVRLGALSRLTPAAVATDTKKALANGQVDVVIGTHALLSKSMNFARLGLVIVDEEQHFGVAQKERLKELQAGVHVLTLTATPIPRTLQLALSGVRDLSLITTPPVDRLAVETHVMPFDPVVLREALLHEYHRGGQSFFVVPRIEDLPKLQEELAELVPEIKIAVAHGGLSAGDLETVMGQFLDRRADLLLCTHIIESGLDIPHANTIIIHRADRFGLSQLYQLRGRVGRGKVRGYAYLTLPAGQVVTESATRRLQVMAGLDQLGAGFQLASHDLDIRGAGNLLGDEQSGQIREVGIELYQQMLADAVTMVRAGAKAGGLAGGADLANNPALDWTPTIQLSDTALFIPEDYIGDLNLRLQIYRRLAELATAAEVEAMAVELIDRFGKLPAQVDNLLQLIAIKQACKSLNIDRLEAGAKAVVLSFHNHQCPNPTALVQMIASDPIRFKLRPDQRLVYSLGGSLTQLSALAACQHLLARLGKLVS